MQAQRPSRKTDLEMRYQRVQLRPPDYHRDKDLLDIWVIHAVEARRVLKSGCGVERIAHEAAERIRRAIAVNLVIAWDRMRRLIDRWLPPARVYHDYPLPCLGVIT